MGFGAKNVLGAPSLLFFFLPVFLKTGKKKNKMWGRGPHTPFVLLDLYV
jgi:hypothetical protein